MKGGSTSPKDAARWEAAWGRLTKTRTRDEPGTTPTSEWQQNRYRQQEMDLDVVRAMPLQERYRLVLATLHKAAEVNRLLRARVEELERQVAAK